MIIVPDPPTRDRCEAFAHWTKHVARGAVCVPPALLRKRDRRLHIRQTMREDHRFRIRNRPEGAAAKFDKLAGSVFSFFRGSALLYYRDVAGTDATLPVVFAMGDAHPENFGVMPSVDGTPIFGVNDFDEAWAAPFSWDVKRCATGFQIVGKLNGLKKRERREVVRAFVGGYMATMTACVANRQERDYQFRLDNSPPMIAGLIEDAITERTDFLDDLIDLRHCRFRPTDEVVPQANRRDEFQHIVDRYVRDNDLAGRARPDGFFTVRDVALKKGSGTASLGLDRFFVLLNGWGDAPGRCVVLEMKQARRSSLFGLVPENGFPNQTGAEQIVSAHNMQLVGGDPFYGWTEIEERSFLVRERSPFKDDIDVDDLDASDMATYADICGRALAHTHVRCDPEQNPCDDAAPPDEPIEARILQSVDPDMFCQDVIEFAHDAAKRLRRDHKLFRRDHENGAFRFA